MFKYINLFLKRIMDLVGSLIGLIILFPAFIIISIAIKLDSKGPVFFKQERLGKKGKVFKIWKFRTMVVNAEKIGDGLTIKNDTDERITKVGKFLRKTSLDEIPQLINVLIGNMSLVGPRPPVTYFPYKGYENYPKWMKKRFLMKPGITGLSQVEYRNNVNWDQRIFLDVKYVEKFHVIYDVLIIMKTVISLFGKNKIYGQTEREKWVQSPIEIENGYMNRIEPWDFKYYYKWRNDKEVFKYLGGGYKKTSKTKMKKIFELMLKDKNNVRYTILNEKFNPIGMIGFYNYDPNNKRIEVGMYIGDKKTQGKGYGKKSYNKAEKEMLKNFEINKFKLFAVEENIRAVKFWQSLGYEKIEKLKDKREIDGKYHNVYKLEKRGDI